MNRTIASIFKKEFKLTFNCEKQLIEEKVRKILKNNEKGCTI